MCVCVRVCRRLPVLGAPPRSSVLRSPSATCASAFLMWWWLSATIASIASDTNIVPARSSSLTSWVTHSPPMDAEGSPKVRAREPSVVVVVVVLGAVSMHFSPGALVTPAERLAGGQPAQQEPSISQRSVPRLKRKLQAIDSQPARQPATVRPSYQQTIQREEVASVRPATGRHVAWRPLPLYYVWLLLLCVCVALPSYPIIYPTGLNSLSMCAPVGRP